MLGDIHYSAFQTEVLLSDYVLRGEFRSRGQLISFVNDRRWSYFSFYDCSLSPIARERRVEGMKQDMMSANKMKVQALCFTDENQVAQLQLLKTSKPTLLYLHNFVVQGKLHVPADAPDEDLFDELKDFFAVSEASIFPLQPVSAAPGQRQPLLLVNQHQIQTYGAMQS